MLPRTDDPIVLSFFYDKQLPCESAAAVFLTRFSSFGKWLAPTTEAYLKLFLHTQLQGREGLRHIADDVLCKVFQLELVLTSISAAWLSRKHKQVNPELLQQAFERIVKRILTTYRTPAHRSKIKLIDSTTVSLPVPATKAVFPLELHTLFLLLSHADSKQCIERPNDSPYDSAHHSNARRNPGNRRSRLPEASASKD